MIGTIRKHSKWLWILIASLTIISFVVFMGKAPMRGAGGRAGGGFGTLYGQPISPLDYELARREFWIFYWTHYHQWPNKSLSAEQLEQEIFTRLLLTRKAEKLGIRISDEALAAAASEFLSSLDRSGQPVRLDAFVQQVLAPEQLGVADLQNFLRSGLAIQQLIQTLGLSGALVTPQEAGLLYDHEYQEVAAQAVFFNASNYLAHVQITPAALAQFYTNNLASYREPDRVQVDFVFFNLTNFLTAAQTELEKTNLTDIVDNLYLQNGQSAVPDAKTPEEAKAKIREWLIHNRAATEVQQAANDFARALNEIEPVKTENLATLARQKNLEVRTTAPFAADFGPAEITVPAAFTKTAFQLNSDVPFSRPIPAADGIFIISLAKQLPSEIPSLEQIHDRVTRDFQLQQATAFARASGAAFYQALTNQIAAGKPFAAAAAAVGHTPQTLPPFSLSTTDLPGLSENLSMGLLKQAAFTTPVGKTSGFIPDSEGGFVMYVEKMLPIDPARKTADLPQFMNQVRRARQSEAFSLWLQAEGNREFRTTLLAREKEKSSVPAAPKP